MVVIDVIQMILFLMQNIIQWIIILQKYAMKRQI